jgi:hypothetical protein
MNDASIPAGGPRGPGARTCPAARQRPPPSCRMLFSTARPGALGAAPVPGGARRSASSQPRVLPRGARSVTPRGDAGCAGREEKTVHTVMAPRAWDPMPLEPLEHSAGGGWNAHVSTPRELGSSACAARHAASASARRPAPTAPCVSAALSDPRHRPFPAQPGAIPTPLEPFHFPRVGGRRPRRSWTTARQHCTAASRGAARAARSSSLAALRSS